MEQLEQNLVALELNLPEDDLKLFDEVSDWEEMNFIAPDSRFSNFRMVGLIKKASLISHREYGTTYLLGT